MSSSISSVNMKLKGDVLNKKQSEQKIIYAGANEMAPRVKSLVACIQLHEFSQWN